MRVGNRFVLHRYFLFFFCLFICQQQQQQSKYVVVVAGYSLLSPSSHPQPISIFVRRKLLQAQAQALFQPQSLPPLPHPTISDDGDNGTQQVKKNHESHNYNHTKAASDSYYLLRGVSDLMHWLQHTEPVAEIDPRLEHAVFDCNMNQRHQQHVRGLKCSPDLVLQLQQKQQHHRGSGMVVARIPAAKILQSNNHLNNLRRPRPKTKKKSKNKAPRIDGNDDDYDWDTDLALRVWHEYTLQDESAFAGYIALLTGRDRVNSENNTSTSSSTSSSRSLGSRDGVVGSGTPPPPPLLLPPSVCPHAIRHWTESQLAPLQSHPAGQCLLQLHQHQMQRWRRKYDDEVVSNHNINDNENNNSSSNSNNNNFPSWEQFQWAMEVVTSRAFRGSANMKELLWMVPSLLPPVVAALVGGLVYNNYSGNLAEISKDWEYGLSSLSITRIYEALSMVAAAPLVLELIKMLVPQAEPSNAVLLPFIDSANHQVTAPSQVQFDSFSNCMELVVSEACVDPNTRQLFISYGANKEDTELLINYGFLPPRLAEENVEEPYSDEVRQQPHRDKSHDDDDDDENSMIRSQLAAAFIARNSNLSLADIHSSPFMK